MSIEMIRMSKTHVTRLFVGGMIAAAAGLILGVAALWVALASDAIGLGGKHVIDVNGGSGAWTALGIHLGDLMVSFAGASTRVAARTASQIFPAPAEDFVGADIDFANGARGRITCLSTPPFYARFTLIGDRGWVEVQEGGNVDKGLPSTFVHCKPDGSRESRGYAPVNTVRMNFEAWADAVEGRAPYRVTPAHLIANIGILDAVTRSAAADGTPVAL